jgi:hypothetical protein
MSNEHGCMKFGLLLLVALAAGCTTKANPASCADDHCSDPAKPFCDEDGSIGGKPDTCIAVECMPGAFETCRGDNALMCNAAGTNFDTVECMYGCSDAAGGCNACEDVGMCGPPTHIVPRYLPTACDDIVGGNDLIVAPSMTIDSSVDANCNGGVVAQGSHPSLCVLRYRSIVVPAGRLLKFTGSRAVALVADDSLTIDGVVDVSADIGVAGPGARVVISGTQASGGNAGQSGAGFQTAGGNGGNGPGATGGIGGAAVADPVFESYLEGGTTAACVNNLDGSGFGGGAVTLISCRGQVAISGTVDAGGGGGPGAFNDLLNTPQSACGGGSGGHIVVQGVRVTVSGGVFANGGGGGAGFQGGSPGMRGEDGSRDSVIPGYGGTGLNGAGFGGNGASNLLPIGGNGQAPTGGGTGGAGGGGFGFVQIFTPFSVTPIIAGAAMSPLPQPHRSIDMK